MARKASSRENAPREQRDGAPPVVEDQKLPRMGEVEIAARRIRRRLVTMPDEPVPYRGTRNLMDPVRRTKERGDGRTKPAQLGDQVDPTVPRVRARKARDDAASEGYIRLRIRVDDGGLTLSGAKFVEGPLVQQTSAHPGLVYEVKVDGRRVAAGDVPESREWRSFPDPLGRPGLEGHHLEAQASFEFFARVPATAVSPAAISSMQLTLYEVSGRGPGEPLDLSVLAKQPKGRVSTIGVLRGIEFNSLPKSLQDEWVRAIR